LDRTKALFDSTFAHADFYKKRKKHFSGVMFQAVRDYQELLDAYSSAAGLRSLLTHAFSIGPEQWKDILKACIRHRRRKKTFYSISELEMLVLSYHFSFAVLTQRSDGNYIWSLYHQGQAHYINPPLSEGQETLLQSCAKEGFLFQRAAGVHFDCALTNEGWQEYQRQNQGRDSAESAETTCRARVIS